MSQGINPNDKKEKLSQKASQGRLNYQQIPTLIDAYKHYIEARTELKPNTVAVGFVGKRPLNPMPIF